METFDWATILPNLAASGNKTDKCRIRLLDTIFVDGKGAVRWFYTSKIGVISKKKTDSVNSESIKKRLVSFSLANPNNTEKIIGVVSKNGSKLLIKENDFDQLDNLSKIGQGYLQIYLRPYRGVEETHIVTIRNDNNDDIISLALSKSTVSGGSVQENSSVGVQLTSFSKEFVNYLRNVLKLQIKEATLEFIVDDNEHVWLSCVPYTVCTSLLSSSSTAPPRFTVTHSNSGSNNNNNSNNTVLPQLSNASAGSRPTSSSTIVSDRNNGSSQSTKRPDSSSNSNSNNNSNYGAPAHVDKIIDNNLPKFPPITDNPSQDHRTIEVNTNYDTTDGSGGNNNVYLNRPQSDPSLLR